MCHVAMFSYTNIVWRQKTIKTSKLFTDLWICREKGKHKNIQKLFHHRPPGPKTQRSEPSEEKIEKIDAWIPIAPLTLSPIIMKVEKMLYLKGNYFWRDPFLTSMIMGTVNKYIPFCFESLSEINTTIASPQKKNPHKARPKHQSPAWESRKFPSHFFFVGQRSVLRLNSLPNDWFSNWRCLLRKLNIRFLGKKWWRYDDMTCFFLRSFFCSFGRTHPDSKNKLHIYWNIPWNIPLGHQSSWL